MKSLIKIISLLIFIIPFAAKGQANTGQPIDSVKLLIDTALNFAKEKSIYRQKVDWAKIDDSVRLQAAKAHNINEAIPAVQTLFRTLGDHHAFMNYNGKYYRWHVPAPPMDTAIYRPLIREVRKAPYIKTQQLDNGYAYLAIPANNPTQPGEQDRIGQQIQDSLEKLRPEELKGLIIDLRLNYGGAMFAMLGGIANLFDPGDLGTFIDPVKNSGEKWGVTANTAYSGTEVYCRVANSEPSLSGLKVVILLSRYTASSGEAVAISFKGRKNTYFIGEETAGYTTSNNSFWIAYSTGVFMSSAIEADRNGNLYWNKGKPDRFVVGGDNFADLLKDLKVREALNWLNKHSH